MKSKILTSNSSMQDFKDCRKLYWFRHVELLVPVEKAESLTTGTSYHEKVEHLLKTGELMLDDDAKTNAMVMAFMKHIYPNISAVSQEEWFEYELPSGNKVHGRIDARGDGYLIEHKTTSGYIDSDYLLALEPNEQIMTYMIAYHMNDMKYTVCVKPTIRQKQNESAEEFQQRCLEWYDEDTERKIAIIDIHRDQEVLDKFLVEQDEVAKEIENCSCFYRNTGRCTKWNRLCDYAQICMNYDPNEKYINFEKDDKSYEPTGEVKN